jgi:hypothetical protein
VFPRNELSARPGRRKAPLTASDGQGAALSTRVTPIAAELTAVGSKLKVAISLLEADRASLGRDVPTMAADFAATSVDIDAISTPTAPEAHVVVLNLTRSLAGPVTTAENDVFALNCAEFGLSGSRLLATADPNVRLVALKVARSTTYRGIEVPYAGGRWGWTAAAHRASVIVKAAAGTARSCPGEGIFFASMDHEGPRGRAVVVLAEEVGSTAPRV